MGAPKWRAQGHSLQLMHNRLQFCTFVAFRALLLSEFATQHDDNRRHLWTSEDKYPKPPCESPHLDVPDNYSEIAAFSIRRFGSQGFLAILLVMKAKFGSRELKFQLPFSVRKGFAKSALLTELSRIDCISNSSEKSAGIT